MNCVTQDRWTELMKIPQKYPKIVPKKYEKSWLIGWSGGGAMLYDRRAWPAGG